MATEVEAAHSCLNSTCSSARGHRSRCWLWVRKDSSPQSSQDSRLVQSTDYYMVATPPD